MSIRWACAIGAVLAGMFCQPAHAQDCSGPALRGSFLQPDVAATWKQEQWRIEFGYMQAAGIDELILQWTSDTQEKTTVYDGGLPGYTRNTREDVVEHALRQADAVGARVYLGLQSNGEWWTKYLSDSTWLKGESRKANALADDLWARYGHHRSLAGWYLGFEVDNARTGVPEWNNLAAFYRETGKHLHRLTPGKPIIIAPFFSTRADLSPSQWRAMWKHVLRRSPIDVIALQDGIGVSHARTEELPQWFAAVKQAIHESGRDVQLWADTETFNSDDEPMAIRQMVNDMCAVRPYVSKYVAFSFGHFLSPQQVRPLHYQSYMEYLRTGKVDGNIPGTPGELRSAAVNATSIRLTWKAPESGSAVAGYKIHRDGRHVATSYSSQTSYVDAELDPGSEHAYAVSAFDAAGNESDVSDAVRTTTPSPRPYPDDMAFGKPYTSSVPPAPEFPDDSGRKLTDGVLGSTDYGDGAWQGRATTHPYSFTVDLGAAREVKEIRSHWAQDKPAAVLLPRSITYLVAADGSEFREVGTILRPALAQEKLLRWYTLSDLVGVSARYVQTRVTPGWDAGWTLVDELEVRR